VEKVEEKTETTGQSMLRLVEIKSSSKKELVKLLQVHGSVEFLKENKVAGTQVAKIAKRCQRDQLLKLYGLLLEKGSTKEGRGAGVRAVLKEVEVGAKKVGVSSVIEVEGVNEVERTKDEVDVAPAASTQDQDSTTQDQGLGRAQKTPSSLRLSVKEQAAKWKGDSTINLEPANKSFLAGCTAGDGTVVSPLPLRVQPTATAQAVPTPSPDRDAGFSPQDAKRVVEGIPSVRERAGSLKGGSIPALPLSPR
jgi:hypothetical protein